MVIRNNVLPVHNHTYFFQYNAQTLLLAYVLFYVFPVKGCFLSQRILSVISQTMPKKMLQFSE